MQNELNTIKNPAIVSTFAKGKNQAEMLFTFGMMDLRDIKIRSLGSKTFECYTDSGSDDYFYFKVEAE